METTMTTAPSAEKMAEITARVKAHAESGLSHDVWWISDCQTLLAALTAQASSLAELQRRVEKLEKWAHEPFDFTHLIKRIEALEANNG